MYMQLAESITCDLNSALSQILKEMGIVQLKDKQREAVIALLGGWDTFVVLPTG